MIRASPIATPKCFHRQASTTVHLEVKDLKNQKKYFDLIVLSHSHKKMIAMGNKIFCIRVLTHYARRDLHSSLK